MSMARCNRCDAFVDTDESDCYPYENEPMAQGWGEDECVCENCQEEHFDRQQERLMEDAA